MPVPLALLGYLAVVDGPGRADMQTTQTLHAFMLPNRLPLGTFYIASGAYFFA